MSLFIEKKKPGPLRPPEDSRGMKAHDHDLKTQLKNSKAEVKELNRQLESAYKSIDTLLKRIAQFESGRLYKLRKLLSHYYKRLVKNLRLTNKKTFFSVLWNYVIKRGSWTLRILLAKILKHLYLWMEPKNVTIVEVTGESIATTAEYTQYLIRKKITPARRELIGQEIRSFSYKPLLSIIVPVYDPPIIFLRQGLDSVVNQLYTNWELCIADDCSTDPKVREVIEEYKNKHSNIRVIYRTENGHISRASNSALELATGEYCVLMDHDDTLSEDALFYVAKALNADSSLDMIYSDEDKINENGIYSEPHFKPEWSPENLLSRNYINHLSIFRTTSLKAIGGWRAGFEGSQDYDMYLRFTEKYKKIKHIPEVLYHWRSHTLSAASDIGAKPYAHIAAQRALTESLHRRGLKGSIDFNEGFRGFKVNIDVQDPSKLVSIIIPSKNASTYIERCVNSIVEKSTYRNFEVILIDNNSDQQEFFDLVYKWKNQTDFSFKYVRDESPFNFSRLINLGRKNASGEYLLLLNNDTEVITPNWIEGLMGYAQLSDIGVVGCKLLYEDETIQHAGVVIGLGDVAGHVLVGEDRDGPGYFNYVQLLNNYSALTAACFMVRTEVFDKVNGFNEEYTVEYNDVDFCLKVREAGYRNVYIPQVELYHYESISRGHPLANSKSSVRHFKEANKLKKEWAKYLEKDPHYNPNLSLHSSNFAIKV
jgi:glycosyltransferase involved in cell wall biosynthesis